MGLWERIVGSDLRIYQGNIVGLQVDAIVNAANRSLLGGGGVDGAIHAAAGPGLLAACRRLGGCAVGCAKITPGFRLKAAYIVHTVGPVWEGGTKNEAQLLASCYRQSLEVVLEANLRSVAFPCISTGAFGYPSEAAASVAVAAVDEVLNPVRADIEVIFCCISRRDFAIYEALLTSKKP
jgi:O-acetyl-ADP-ribose deacetylase (regulator of RNase III)